MKRKATAVWHGDGLTGSGVLSTESGVLKEQPFSFKLRFVNEHGTEGTNPEELIGAAHAGCFSMALSFALANAGVKAESIQTTAEVDVQKTDSGFVIAGIALKLSAKVPGISKEKFLEIAQGAKANCPVSKALAATPISLEAILL